MEGQDQALAISRHGAACARPHRVRSVGRLPAARRDRRRLHGRLRRPDLHDRSGRRPAVRQRRGEPAQRDRSPERPGRASPSSAPQRSTAASRRRLTGPSTWRPGDYTFFCTIHPTTMQATLVVTGNGTPQARPDRHAHPAHEEDLQGAEEGHHWSRLNTCKGSRRLPSTAKLGKATIGKTSDLPWPPVLRMSSDQAQQVWEEQAARQAQGHSHGDRRHPLRLARHGEGEAQVARSTARRTRSATSRI